MSRLYHGMEWSGLNFSAIFCTIYSLQTWAVCIKIVEKKFQGVLYTVSQKKRANFGKL